MNDDKKPNQPPSAVTLLISVGATCYFLWVVLLAGGERPSTTLAILYWVVILLNLIFLGFTLARWRK